MDGLNETLIGLKLFQCFQKFSISKGIKGTLSCVDRLAKEFDIEVNEWKSNIEVNCQIFKYIMVNDS